MPLYYTVKQRYVSISYECMLYVEIFTSSEAIHLSFRVAFHGFGEYILDMRRRFSAKEDRLSQGGLRPRWSLRLESFFCKSSGFSKKDIFPF